MRSILSSKSNKKGQVLNLVSGVVIGLMILIFTIFAVLFGIAKLNPSSFFTAGGADANATAQLQSNLTTGVSQFGQNIPTAFVVLGVVLILSFLAILISIVIRFRGASSSGGL